MSWFSSLFDFLKASKAVSLPAPAVVSSRFNPWFKWLLQWEGSVYENDPDDAGGATKYGIDQRSHPHVNIRTLTQQQAADIYLVEAWNAMHADELPAGLGEVLANITVNCGPGCAVPWLQAALGLKVDLYFGPITLKSAKAARVEEICPVLIARTESFYHAIAHGKKAKFLGGWLNRNNSLAKFIKPLISR